MYVKFIGTEDDYCIVTRKDKKKTMNSNACTHTSAMS